MHAIILAGGAGQDMFATQQGFENKALVPINDVPMISYVLDAIIKSPRIDEIVVVGPEKELAPLLPEQVRIIPDQGDVVSNALAALKQLSPASRVVICTSDIPMLTTEALESVLRSAEEREADIYYPIISRSECERRYPGVKRTYTKLRDGVFTGGNIFVIHPERAQVVADTVRRVIADRKNPGKMLLVFGLPGLALVMKMLIGILTIKELEVTLSRILGIKGAAIVCPYPEVGTDVDKDSDLELARRVLAAGS